MTLPELIKKLEAATEGSRELDLEIEIACKRCAPDATLDSEDPDLLYWNEYHPFGSTYAAEPCGDYLPYYTTSLDAAVSLVPEVWSIMLDICPDGIICTVHDDSGHIAEPTAFKISSAPLAVCIAALKARLAMGS